MFASKRLVVARPQVVATRRIATTCWRGNGSKLAAFRQDHDGQSLRMSLKVAPSFPRLSLLPSNLSRSFSTSTCLQDAEKQSGSSDAAPKLETFESLKGSIDRRIFRSLTVSPFQFTHMSPVQHAVLSQLPGIAQLDYPSSQHKADLESHFSQRSHRGSSNDLRYGGEEDEESSAGFGAGALVPKGQDLLVKSKTGTGKTVGFLVPALEAHIQALRMNEERLQRENPKGSEWGVEKKIRDMAGILIISPTRELASQISAEAEKLCSGLNMDVHTLVGGVAKGAQLNRWRTKRKDVVVATPGRLMDLMNSLPSVRESLSSCHSLILDEADTLLDMGFKDEIETIIKDLPPKTCRQNFLFSATIPPAVKEIARKTLKPNHLFIDTVPANESNVHAHIPQHLTVLDDPSQLIPHIARLIAHDQMLHPEGGKSIIFLPTTRYTELYAELFYALRRILPFSQSTRILEMHSKKSQTSRTKSAQEFKQNLKGTYQILVSSDVSARGVDYPGVTRVIQVGVPASPNMYVHRVGRTGRAGKDGRGDIVLLPFEQGYFKWQLQDVPLQKTSTEEFRQEVEDLATKLDANPPSKIFDEYSSRSPRAYDRGAHRGARSTGLEYPLLAKINKIEEHVENNVMSRIPEDQSQQVFMSLLGYYAPLAGDVRVTKEEVIDGLATMAQEGLGLSEKPYVSQKLLQLMGFGEKRQQRKESLDWSPRSRSRSAGGWSSRGGDSGSGGRDSRRPSPYGVRRNSFGGGESSFGGSSRYPSSGGGYSPRSEGGGRGWRDDSGFGSSRGRQSDLGSW